ncbi:MAG: PAS domain-containing protein [Candidatus Niyogibacteria bacterium]|nr:PAS domain-containing protein [Candidatus Niyogibacteria bacterium]
MLLVKTSLSSVFYASILVHSFVMLTIAAVIFFICFFSYQHYAKDKDIRWYVISLAFYILGFFSFVHAVLVPAFGWGGEELFDISEHYGFFLASLLLYGLIVPFSDRIKEKIYQGRMKIFIGANLLLLIGFVLLFFLPSFAGTAFRSINFFIGFTVINFLLLLFMLFARKEDSFFASPLLNVLALLTVATLTPFFYREWNLVWWYYHFLWFSALLLLRAKEERNVVEILFSSFSIRTRLFFIIGLLLMAVSLNGFIDFRLSRNHLYTQTLESLDLMADVQGGWVLDYLDGLKNRAVDFASDGFIRESLKKILSGDREAASNLNRHLLENKQSLDPAIVGIIIMDMNGRVVAASQETEVGMKDMATDKIFIRTMGGRYGEAFLSNMTEDFHFGEKHIVIKAAAPVIDQERKENMGVIVLFFNTASLSDILIGRTSTTLGAISTWMHRKKTIETYLVNQDGVMLTESRFIANAPLNQKVDTVPVRLCAKSEEMSGEYLGYRNSSVFGASMCLFNGWTLLTEIDKDEMLATLGDYLQQNLLSASATFLLIFLVMYLFMVGITSPLRELSEVVYKIGRGDFTARAALITRDEFGQLGRVFNQMVENVQKSSAGLRNKVKEEEMSRLATTNILEDLEIAKNQIELAKVKDEATLASIGDGVIGTDTDGKIVLMNTAAQGMLLWPIEEAIGRASFDVVSLEDENQNFVPREKRPVTLALTGTITVGNIYYCVRQDKTKFPVAIKATPIVLNGKIIGVAEILRDITKEREIEKLRTDFLSLASHQLRTPLSGTKWLIETLQRNILGELTSKQKEYLDNIYQSNERMLRLVSDMLNVLRLEGGGALLKKETISIKQFLEDTVLFMKSSAESKKVLLRNAFKGDQTIKMETDCQILRSIFECFVSNAINYSLPKQEIVFDVKEEPLTYVFSVKDSGIGIPPDEQKKIFERFYRASNAKALKPDGTGLGLYIAALLAEKLGGEVTFESEEGKGSTFYLHIPKIKKHLI